MSNRFHNKFHRANHHSQVTAKNASIIDASLDPIASYSEPFQGEFYTDGEITTNSFLSAVGNVITNSNAIVRGNLYAATAILSGDLFVSGNAQIEGSVTHVNTEIYTTSAVEIVNNGTGPALTVRQTGNEAIMEVYDDTNVALFIDGRIGTDGNVGIGTSSPNERLTVIGSITSNETIYDSSSNSIQWRGAHTSVVSNSSTWTDLRALSGNWQSTYTTVDANSATWKQNVTDLQTLSGNWESTYTTFGSASSTFSTYTYLHNHFLALTGGMITGDLSVSGGLKVGTPSNTSTLYVNQTAVGINTENPNKHLTVIGDISATGNVYSANINPVCQATYYKSANQNLNNGSTDITFDLDATWNNDNGYMTHTSGSADFTVVKTGVYQLEWNASIIANGATWNTATNKVISIDITRSPNAEQIVIGQTTVTATTTNYNQSLCSTVRLEAGDIINFRIQGNYATATPYAQGVTSTFDLNTWFYWRFIS